MLEGGSSSVQNQRPIHTGKDGHSVIKSKSRGKRLKKAKVILCQNRDDEGKLEDGRDF